MEQEKLSVNLNWTWWVFLAANVLLMVGVAISWGICGKGATNYWIPMSICNIASMLLMAIFYYFDGRDLYLIKQHIPKKIMRLYFVVGFFFVISLILVSVYVLLSDQIINNLFGDSVSSSSKINITFGILFGIQSFLSLVTIGLYRYTKYKIDLTLIRRKHGESTGDEVSQPIPPTPQEQPTTDIVDHATTN